MQGTVEVPHPIASAHLPEAAAVFDAATALDTAMDTVDPQPTLVELLVSQVLLPRECLPQIGINSSKSLVQHEKQPQQSQQHELIEKKGWNHGQVPSLGNETGRVYLILGLIELSTA